MAKLNTDKLYMYGFVFNIPHFVSSFFFMADMVVNQH